VETAPKSNPQTLTPPTGQMNKNSPARVVEFFEEPVRSCARFYGYYYLSEIEQDEFAAQQFDNLTGRMSNAFYDYAVYATLLEMSNMDSHFALNVDRLRNEAKRLGFQTRKLDEEEVSVSRAAISLRSKEAERRIIGNTLDPLTKDQEADGLDVYRAAQKIEQIRNNLMESKQDRVQKVLGVGDELLNTFTNPDETLRLMRSIFGGGKTTTEAVGRWIPPFGGPAWADITEAVLSRPDQPQTVWLDMMWALEHNTSSWVDKVPLTGTEQQDYIDKSVSQLPSVPPAFEKTTAGLYKKGDVLQQILDYKRKGEFYRFWPFITNADDILPDWESTLRQAGR